VGSRRRVRERDFFQGECFSAVEREPGECYISGVRDQRVRLGRVLRKLECSGTEDVWDGQDGRMSSPTGGGV